jgi:mannosyltransferase
VVRRLGVPPEERRLGASTLSDAPTDSRRQPSITNPVAQSLLLVLIVIAGTLFRLHLLTKRDLWVDEALSIVLAQLGWRDFWTALWNSQANMSFYYVLMRAWLHLGDSEVVVRGLSVLFGVATIPATFVLGKKLFGEKVAIISAALSAVNIFQIRYSQEARGYSLVMLLAVLSTYFFLRAIHSRGEKRYWVGYVLISVLGVYTHVFFYLVVAAHWLSLGYAKLRSILDRTVAWTVVSFILLTIPMNAFILMKDQGRPNWVPRPTVQQLLSFANLFTGNGGVALLAIYLVLCLAAVFGTRQPNESTSSGFDESWPVRLVAWWLIFPIALTLLISFFRPVFYDRFMAISAPALVLLAGKGMHQLGQSLRRPRGLFPASLLIVIGLSAWGVIRFNNSPASEGDEWRLATRYVLDGQQPEDAVFLYRASGSWPFAYYLHREMEEHRVTFSPKVVFPLDPTNPQQEPDAEQTSLAIRGRKRIWLILQHYETPPSRLATARVLQSALAQDYRVSQEQVFPGETGPIRILLYVRLSGAG